MSLVLVTRAASGFGRGVAAELLDAGHDVIVHARSRRHSAVHDPAFQDALLPALEEATGVGLA